MLRRILFSMLALAPSVPILSQTPAAGERLGAVHFATSCDSPRCEGPGLPTARSGSEQHGTPYSSSNTT